MEERMLLRKLADNYYGAWLSRVIDGIVHNLNGPLQILFIRSEQLEQGVRQLETVLQSEALAEVEGFAGRAEKQIQSLSENLDKVNAQVRHLTGDLVVERCSEIKDVDMNQVIEDCLFLLNADMFFKHHVKKTIRLNDALPAVTGRKSDFCIIVLNIVQNALEALVEAPDKQIIIA
jgi:C4-dicarboxylate-specific signal transduction histidine kinase